MEHLRARAFKIVRRGVVWFAAFLTTMPLAYGANDFWNNAGGGLFSADANWVDGTTPGANDIANFTLPDTYLVQWTPSVGNRVNRRLFIPAGDVTFLASGGDFTYALEDTAENFGWASVDGGRLTLGALSGASLLLDAKDIFEVNSNSSLEVGFGSRINTQSFRIGNGSNGTPAFPVVNVLDGARIDAVQLHIGGYEDSYNTLHIDGANSAVNSASMILGRGQVTVANGAVFTTTSASFLGTFAGNNAGVTIGSSGSSPATWNANEIHVGGTSGAGIGMITVSNGDVTASSITVQHGSTVQVNEGTLTTSNLDINGGRLLITGFAGQAAVNITNPFGELRLSRESLSFGSINLDANRQLHVAGTTVVESGATIQTWDAAGFSSSKLVNHGRLQVINDLTIGNAAAHGAYSGGGELTVSGNMTIHDAGFADLGYFTDISFGTLTAPNGVALPAGGDLVLHGLGNTVNAKLATAPGSNLVAEYGTVGLGDAASVAGISIGGELHVNNTNVILYDANLAELGTLTTLGRDGFAGSLQANHGLIIEQGDNITGYGSIDTPNDSATPVIVNGYAAGESLAAPLTFSGYVKGSGTFENVVFTGTHSPGNSIGVLDVGDVSYSDSSTLVMELGGGGASVGFDQINSDGALWLDGLLRIELLSPTLLAANQSFELLTSALGISGQFDAVVLPTLLQQGLALDLEYTTNSVLLNVVSAPNAEGDFDADGDVDGSDFLRWQRGESPNSLSVGDLADWQAHFGPSSVEATGATSQVPEPRTLALALAAACLGAAVRRRQPRICSTLRNAVKRQ